MDDVVDAAGRWWDKDVLDQRASYAAGGYSLVSTSGSLSTVCYPWKGGWGGGEIEIPMIPHRIIFAFDILDLCCCQCSQKGLLLSLTCLESVRVT